LAEANKVGEARQEPNVNPFLPPPLGRLSFSLNPLKMFVSYNSNLKLSFYLVTIGWPSHEKKNLLLLLLDCHASNMYNVFANDHQ